MSKEQLEVDYMPIVRAIVKMSSMLNEADDVMDGKYFKFGFKNAFNKWIDVFEKSSKPLLGAFMNDSEEALQEAYTRFLDFTKDVKVKSKERTDLILLYCKLKSAYNDLEEVPFDSGGMMTIIIKKHTEKVLNAIEKQYADIFTVRDINKDTIHVIIASYDALGKSMFVKK